MGKTKKIFKLKLFVVNTATAISLNTDAGISYTVGRVHVSEIQNLQTKTKHLMTTYRPFNHKGYTYNLKVSKMKVGNGIINVDNSASADDIKKVKKYAEESHKKVIGNSRV